MLPAPAKEENHIADESAGGTDNDAVIVFDMLLLLIHCFVLSHLHVHAWPTVLVPM